MRRTHALALLVLALGFGQVRADDFMTTGITPELKVQAKPCPYSDARMCWLFGDANFTFTALTSIRNRLLSDEQTIAAHTNQIAALQAAVASLQKIVGGTQGAPTVSGINPTSGPVGTQVTITGTKFTGATSVNLNGTTASYTVASDTSVLTRVPTGATTGLWAVTTAGGSASSATFTVSATGSAPTIASIAPNNGSRGDAVTVTGTNLTGTTGVTFNGAGATYSTISSSSVAALVPAAATSGGIAVTTSAGSATSGTFTVTAPDNILASNLISLPTTGWLGTNPDTGDTVIATIAYVSGAKGSVTEAGATGPHFIQTWNSGWSGTPTLNVPYKFSARLTAGSTSTPSIQIQSYGQTSPTANVNLATCTATDANGATHTIAPVSGVANSCDVTVTGNFIPTTFSHNGASWNISVITSGGAPNAGVALYVENARLQQGSGVPTITSFSPASGPVGTTVTLSGRNFTGATAVRFNGASASFSTASDTTITAVVPTGATTGLISVVTPSGTGNSTSSYTVQ